MLCELFALINGVYIEKTWRAKLNVYWLFEIVWEDVKQKYEISVITFAWNFFKKFAKHLQVSALFRFTQKNDAECRTPKARWKVVGMGQGVCFFSNFKMFLF